MGFAELERWDPSSFHGIAWHWPREIMASIGSLLRPRKERVPATTAFAELQPVSIHFDGSMSKRKMDSGREYTMDMYFARPGDVVVAKIDLKNGAVAIVPDDWNNVAVTGHFAVYEPDRSRLLPEYLHRIVQSRFFKNHLWRNKVGAEGRKEVKLDWFASLEIPLPPPPTQQAIVRRWREAQDAAEAARSEADVIEHEAALAFLHGLGLKAPEEANPCKCFALRWDGMERWGVMSSQRGARGLRLEDGLFPVVDGETCIAEVIHGCSVSPSPVPTELGVLKISAVTRGALDINERKFAPDTQKLRKQYALCRGDVLLCRTNGTLAYVGQSALVESDQADLIFPDKVIRVRLLENMLPAFFWRVLQTPPLRSQIEAFARTAVGNYAIGGRDLWRLRLPLPPIEIQRALVAAIADARTHAASLRAEAEQLKAVATTEVEAAILGKAKAIGADDAGCDHSATLEIGHDHPATATTRPTSEAMARRPSGRGQPAGGLSCPGAGVHPEFHGPGERAGGAPGGGSSADSTRPLDATRELATAAGSLTYTQVSERLAAKVADCLDELLDAEPEDIAITPDWLRELHRRIAGELFPDWAGRFRTTDVQVGTHFPPPAHALAVHVRDFCLDLEERLRHLAGAESIADLLAWVDWRFQWIHPFKDFNGRVGRVLLVALAYKLRLPPPDPADVANKAGYFAALRAADAGDPGHLRDIWLARLAR